MLNSPAMKNPGNFWLMSLAFWIAAALPTAGFAQQALVSSPLKKGYRFILQAEVRLKESEKNSQVYKQYFTRGEADQSGGWLGAFANSHCEITCQTTDCHDRLNVVPIRVKDGSEWYTGYQKSTQSVDQLVLAAGMEWVMQADAVIDGNEASFTLLNEKSGAILKVDCGRATGTFLIGADFEDQHLANALGVTWGFKAKSEESDNSCYGKRGRHFRHFKKFEFVASGKKVLAYHENGSVRTYENQKSLADFMRDYRVCQDAT